MSYEPILIIKAEDLKKHETELTMVSCGAIKDEHTRGGEDNKTAMEYISDIFFRDTVHDIFGVEC